MQAAKKATLVDMQKQVHHVVVMIYDGIQALDATGPMDAFASANAFGGAYELTTTSITGRDVVASSGVRLGVDKPAESVSGTIGTLLVPGAPDWQASISDPHLVDAVRTLAQRAQRVVSICAGAFPLAATGLLDGHAAATHWKLARQLAARFPDVAVDPAAIFVTAGRFVSSAGVTAGIDLTLSLIENDYGATVAREVAKDLVVFMARPGDQSQFSVRLEALPTDNSVVRAAMNSITANPQADHSLRALAAQAGVSPRHLSRLFLTETGYTPHYFIDRTRLEAACTMLNSGRASLDQIAERSGIGSSESLRRLFKRELGITPATYRRRFATTAPLPSVGSAS